MSKKSRLRWPRPIRRERRRWGRSWVGPASVVLALAAIAAGCGSDAAPPKTPALQVEDPTQVLAKAQEAGEYAVLWFHGQGDREAGRTARLLQRARQRWGGQARVVRVALRKPGGEPLAKRYRVRRTPQILVVAPNGAVTAWYPRLPKTAQLEQAFVGPGMADILLAVQEDQTVFLCVGEPADPVAQQSLAAAREAESLLEGIAKVVAADPGDRAEAALLEACKLSSDRSTPATLVISPRGSLVARFEGTVEKEDLFDSFAKILQIPRGCGSAGVTGGSTCQPGRGVSGDAGCD